MLADLPDNPLKANDGASLTDTAESFGWCAHAVLCYKQGWFEEALAICDQWERYREKRGYGEQSYWAIRAACYLALGKEDKSREPICRILARSEVRGIWARNLPALQKAIERGDTEYRYAPGNYPPPFSLIVAYQ